MRGPSFPRLQGESLLPGPNNAAVSARLVPGIDERGPRRRRCELGCPGHRAVGGRFSRRRAAHRRSSGRAVPAAMAHERRAGRARRRILRTPRGSKTVTSTDSRRRSKASRSSESASESSFHWPPREGALPQASARGARERTTRLPPDPDGPAAGLSVTAASTRTRRRRRAPARRRSRRAARSAFLLLLRWASVRRSVSMGFSATICSRRGRGANSPDATPRPCRGGRAGSRERSR
jgi:hypothetical protein